MDVRSDMQRQDQELPHPRNIERERERGREGKRWGFQKDHGETIELARACDEDR